MSVEIDGRENEDRTMVAHTKELSYHYFASHFCHRLATIMHSVGSLFVVPSACEVS